MSAQDRDHRYPSDAVFRQAERWVARLHSSACPADDRKRFQDWLARHPTHWLAYNRTEQLWTAAERMNNPDITAMADMVLVRARQKQNAAPRRRRIQVAAVAAVIVIAGLPALFMLAGRQQPPEPAPLAYGYGTAIGEIRSVTLPDRSVVTLNTDTLLQVRIGRHARTVTLRRGEAQFDVAADASRPFTVETARVTVTALGTVFQVRSNDAQTDVGLLAGRVRVRSTTSGKLSTVDLVPGRRLVARADTAWQISRLDTDAAHGWLKGQLVFDATPLRQAVDEFNRYSSRKFRLADPETGELRIHGIFNAGDMAANSRTLQHAYPLRVEEQGGDLVLRRR